jgi:hypothetical protein
MKLGWPYPIAREIPCMQVEQFAFSDFPELLAVGRFDVFSQPGGDSG